MSWTQQLHPRLHSLRGRLAVFYAAMITCVLLLFGAVVYGTATFIEEQEDEPVLQKERELTEFRHLLILSLGAVIPLGVVLAALGSSWMTRKTVKALSELVGAASQVGPEQLSWRLPESEANDAEIQSLVRVLNQMLDRVDRSVTSLRRFTSDAAHELRTPLADLMGRLEISLRRPRGPDQLRTTMEETLEGLGRLMRLTEILLLLARSDAGMLPVAKETRNLSTLIRDVVSLYEGIAAERRLSLTIDCAPQQAIETDALLLHRTLANLIDNAIKFSPPGSEVRVQVASIKDPARTAPPRPDTLQIRVTDSGPGLGEADVAQLFERFYRSPAQRGSTDGFGLGLSIVRSFVHALGGTIDLHSTPSGTTATVCLPQPIHEKRLRK